MVCHIHVTHVTYTCICALTYTCYICNIYMYMRHVICTLPYTRFTYTCHMYMIHHKYISLVYAPLHIHIRILMCSNLLGVIRGECWPFIRIWCVCVYTYMHVYVYVCHGVQHSLSGWSWLYIWIVWIDKHIYICIHIYVYIYICIYIYRCVYMFIYQGVLHFLEQRGVLTPCMNRTCVYMCIYVYLYI